MANGIDAARAAREAEVELMLAGGWMQSFPPALSHNLWVDNYSYVTFYSQILNIQDTSNLMDEVAGMVTTNIGLPTILVQAYTNADYGNRVNGYVDYTGTCRWTNSDYSHNEFQYCTNVSMGFWFKITNNNTTLPIWGPSLYAKPASTYSSRFRLSMSSSQLNVYGGTNTAAVCSLNPGAMPTAMTNKLWHFIGVAFDGTLGKTNACRIYYDGTWSQSNAAADRQWSPMIATNETLRFTVYGSAISGVPVIWTMPFCMSNTLTSNDFTTIMQNTHPTNYMRNR